MAIKSEQGARDHAATLLDIILNKDAETLQRIDCYMHGHHDDPYMPATAGDEYKLLAERAVDNWMPLLVNTPAQALYVDSFRPGRKVDPDEERETPEWRHWQQSRLDARQSAVYRGALTYGHSFTITERDFKGNVVTKGLSARNTAALFDDPANDEAPAWALTIVKRPKGEARGYARMWSENLEYEVTWKTDDKPTVTGLRRHGVSSNPVTRFATHVDLEGRTMGVVEPLIVAQNRINQTIFDLLVAQTYGSFNVRWITGMAPPVKMRLANPGTEDEEWVPEVDGNGQEIPVPVQSNASRMMFSENNDAKFGSLPATPLGGYIESIEMSIRHFSAQSQTPPHHMLGQIANLSAEALDAAETSLARMVDEFRASFGESWERVFRVAAELSGETSAVNDYNSEVVWRDVGSRSMASTADALGKLRQNVDAPVEGLWEMIPGMTKNQLDRWKDLKDAEPELALTGAINRATAPPVTTRPVLDE